MVEKRGGTMQKERNIRNTKETEKKKWHCTCTSTTVVLSYMAFSLSLKEIGNRHPKQE